MANCAMRAGGGRGAGVVVEALLGTAQGVAAQ